MRKQDIKKGDIVAVYTGWRSPRGYSLGSLALHKAEVIETHGIVEDHEYRENPNFDESKPSWTAENRRYLQVKTGTHIDKKLTRVRVFADDENEEREMNLKSIDVMAPWDEYAPAREQHKKFQAEQAAARNERTRNRLALIERIHAVHKREGAHEIQQTAGAVQLSLQQYAALIECLDEGELHNLTSEAAASFNSSGYSRSDLRAA